MRRRTKQIGVVLALIAILLFAWPVWKLIYVKPVNASLLERTKALVEKNPQLQPAWDKAMQDQILTWPEAKEIVESAGEKVESGE